MSSIINPYTLIPINNNNSINQNNNNNDIHLKSRVFGVIANNKYYSDQISNSYDWPLAHYFPRCSNDRNVLITLSRSTGVFTFSICPIYAAYIDIECVYKKNTRNACYCCEIPQLSIWFHFSFVWLGRRNLFSLDWFPIELTFQLHFSTKQNIYFLKFTEHIQFFYG